MLGTKSRMGLGLGSHVLWGMDRDKADLGRPDARMVVCPASSCLPSSVYRLST